MQYKCWGVWFIFGMIHNKGVNIIPNCDCSVHFWYELLLIRTETHQTFINSVKNDGWRNILWLNYTYLETLLRARVCQFKYLKKDTNPSEWKSQEKYEKNMKTAECTKEIIFMFRFT